MDVLHGKPASPDPARPAPVTQGDTRYFDWIAPWYDVQCSLFGLGRGFREWTLALAELQPGDHVLDAGCGNGVLTRRIANCVGPTGEVWGIDPAPDMIRAAMQDAGRRGNAAHLKLAAIEKLPFADDSFDVALISLVLHHMPLDLKIIGLREIHRVLKPDGRLLVVEPDRPDHWLLRILYWPMRFYPNLKEHLEGRTPDMLRAGGSRRQLGLAGGCARSRSRCRAWILPMAGNCLLPRAVLSVTPSMVSAERMPRRWMRRPWWE
jgi:ubiquinone/menaquinone biosynthesis C-methylase UbiE